MILRNNFLLIFLLITFSTLYAQKTINIGLLTQDKTDVAAVHGAEMAVYLANKNGGLNGQQFRIIIKSMEGPWGTGSKQAVSLIWDENVCALIGSHDGRNAHLVEQASAKSIVPFISAWSSDPTLSQAYIPWFFNCVPNDDQQAEALIKEIFNTRKYGKVTVLSDETYDSQQALKSFLKMCRLQGKNLPVSVNFDLYKENFTDFVQAVRSTHPECIVLVSDPDNALQMTRLLIRSQLKIPIYGSIFVLNENRLNDDEILELEKVLQLPTGSWSPAKIHNFRKSFIESYGRNPGMVASYAFDAMSVLIEAIKKAGSDEHERIEKELSELIYQGVTGPIKFSNLGVRLNACYFSERPENL